MATSVATVEIRTRSARLRRFLTVLSVCLCGLFVLERFGVVAVGIAAHGFDAETGRRLALQAVVAVPEAAYLFALWWIRQSLAAFARGELFAPTITSMLDRVGVTLAVGAFAGTFVVPAAERALGAAPGYWIAFDVAGVVLGAVGLALTVIAHVLRRARVVQTELDEMF